MESGIQCLAHTAEGFRRMYENGQWTVALKNAGPSNRRENVRRLERHLATDEIFILMKGRAGMLEGRMRRDESLAVREMLMRPYEVYVIRRGTWHNTWMDEGAVFAVIENADTSYDNTDVCTFEACDVEEQDGTCEA